MSADQAVGRDFDLGRQMTGVVGPSRYHALDRVRALAMLLGVVYHTLIFRMFTGGPPPFASMGQLGASKVLGDWLHSFRMPLFFLIAGFFGRMMLQKYGTKEFLRKRWWRIGVPLVVGLFTFGPLYSFTLQMIMRPPNFGPGGGPEFGPGRMGPPGAMMRPPESMIPPPEGLVDGREAPPGFAGMPGPGAFPPGGPGFGPLVGGPPGGGPGFGPRPGGGPPFGPPGGDGIASKIFGPFARLFQLNHLWFLWYLLLFVTAAPFLMGAVGLVVRQPAKEGGDRLGLKLVRWGLAPVLLAAISTPALLMTQSPFGWFLGIVPAIFRAFPDFLLHLDVEMAFYFVYFMTGWWLHRERGALPNLARAWLPNAIVGLGAFAIAIGLEQNSHDPGSRPNGGSDRVIAYASYCLGSACTSFAFLGVFLRYLDFPSKSWRYLADTALWVYLIHQPLVLLGLTAVRPLDLPWWALTVVVSGSSIVASLLLYEAIVRHTPLVRLFGPSSSRRLANAKEIGENGDRALTSA